MTVVPLKKSCILQVEWWSSVEALLHRSSTAQEQAQSARWWAASWSPNSTGMRPRISEERTVLLQCVSLGAGLRWQGLQCSRKQREVPHPVREPARLPRFHPDGTWKRCQPPSYCCKYHCCEGRIPPTDQLKHFPLSLRQNITRDQVKKHTREAKTKFKSV